MSMFDFFKDGDMEVISPSGEIDEETGDIHSG
jgi:hypothetical protein